MQWTFKSSLRWVWAFWVIGALSCVFGGYIPDSLRAAWGDPWQVAIWGIVFPLVISSIMIGALSGSGVLVGKILHNLGKPEPSDSGWPECLLILVMVLCVTTPSLVLLDRLLEKVFR